MVCLPTTAWLIEHSEQAFPTHPDFMSVRQTHGQVRETGNTGGLSRFGASSSIPAKRPSAAPVATAGNSKRKSIISISSDEGGENDIKPPAGSSTARATRRATKRTPVTVGEYRKVRGQSFLRWKLQGYSSLVVGRKMKSFGVSLRWVISLFASMNAVSKSTPDRDSSSAESPPCRRLTSFANVLKR